MFDWSTGQNTAPVKPKFTQYAQNSSKFDILKKKFRYTLQFSNTRKKVYRYTLAYFWLKMVYGDSWAFYKHLSKIGLESSAHLRENRDLMKSSEILY